MNTFVVISGCSGSGKSTLIAELARRGHTIIEEPGRRVVKAELLGDGSALPWADPIAFARRAIATALDDRAAVSDLQGWVFFDRGLIDAAAALQHLTGEPALSRFGSLYRYHSRVFLAPPWPDIYVNDAERGHDFDAAVEEYSRLVDVYPSLGYEVSILPKTTVAERADFVLRVLAE